MIVRLTIQSGDGPEREFEFHRSKISLGRSPLNDLVCNLPKVPASLGLLEIPRDEGTIKLRSVGHGCPIVLLRDGKEEFSSDGQTSVSLPLEPGDQLFFGEDRQVVLTIRSVQAVDRLGLTYPLVPETNQRPFAQFLWLTAEQYPNQNSYTQLLRALVSSLINQSRLPLRQATITMFSSNEEYLNEVYMLRPLEPHPGAVIVPGNILGSACPINALEHDRDELLQELKTSKRLALLTSGQTYTLFFGISNGANLRGVLALEGDANLTSDELSRCSVWWSEVSPDVQNFLVHASLTKRTKTLAEENRHFRERERRHYLFKELICESPKMRNVYDQLHQWVEGSFPVLIMGEAGTGKELLARALHHLGPRKEGMLMSIRCGSMSEEQLDIELFGCVASHLPNAVADRKGVFELAQTGTVFLEEIDQASPNIQAKLVRMLNEGEVRRSGDSVGRKVSVRLVTSIHRDLARVLEEHLIRHDLYLLIRDHTLEIPPLRDRHEDILPLAHTFVRQYARRYDKSCHRLSPILEERLLAHDWPGNIRELQTRIESGLLRASGDAIELEDLFI